MDWVGSLWHYAVLDEGHVARNPKTLLFKAITKINASHRLILSGSRPVHRIGSRDEARAFPGTPVQNSVTELWALFEFLMPGYLGTQAQFHVRLNLPDDIHWRSLPPFVKVKYARPILKTKDAALVDKKDARVEDEDAATTEGEVRPTQSPVSALLTKTDGH